MKNNTAAIAAFSISTAIVLGAWNAHGMEAFVISGQISEKYLKTFYTGVQYQFFCSLGVLILGLSATMTKWMKTAIWLILIGMLLFSVSLYFLAFHQMLGEGLKKLGMITPIGGLLMAAGWLTVGLNLIVKTKK
jgi:uncharacterized membrane protein YgdD (TMEM256/DUF423 family)